MQASVGGIAKITGGRKTAVSLNPTTNGAIIDPIRAVIEENPKAAFRTTVGNSSEQYKYTSMKTTNAAKLPTQAQPTDIVPSGKNANAYKQIAQIAWNNKSMVLRFITLMRGTDANVPNKAKVALMATLTKISPVKKLIY
ncbi:unnamed protein product [Arctia plantaginis]|uniref:Uncharacterized protein n=1 Tax=Arctia plantaginis TaxID=874455 RepID=A0A8S1B849_ARCPL|nr:unnamed protein product [Arctia plantaginis]CAB3254854.1 unnamed protein product [Arctia plantaginis]